MVENVQTKHKRHRTEQQQKITQQTKAIAVVNHIKDNLNTWLRQVITLLKHMLFMRHRNYNDKSRQKVARWRRCRPCPLHKYNELS